MFKDIVRYRLDYALLAALCMGYLVSVITHRTDNLIIFVSTVVFALAYFLWGVAHQLHAKAFHARIVLEYLLVAALALTIVSTLLL